MGFSNEVKDIVCFLVTGEIFIVEGITFFF